MALLAAALCCGLASPATAQTVIRVASGMNAPLFATAPPGDTNRLFIVEQGSGGTADIKILNLATGAVNATPFLTISGIATGGEQGLLGLAFDPDYATNGRFYVDYTATGGTFGSGVTHITRYQVSSTDANVANAASAADVLTINQPQTNHNGGWIGFSNRASDTGNLYIAMGDGGNSNDQGTGHIEPGGNAQNTSSLLGKMLRINVDTAGPASHPNYAIPTNNPYANGVNGAPEVWLYGLRNPFRDSFDSQTGNLMIGDVGQDHFEEINVQKASNPGGNENYGWRLREGTMATTTGGVGGNAPGATDPIFTYNHTDTGIAVIGGYVYHGTGAPSLAGKYVFGDLQGTAGQGKVFTLQYDGTTATNFTDITSQLFTGTGYSLVNLHSFGTDANGELYILDGASGSIYRIVQATVPGDATHDGVVNGLDISAIAAAWLQTGGNQLADVNHDGVVNGLDISLVAGNWLQRQPSGGNGAAVPEPSALMLGLGGAVLLAGCVLRGRILRAPSSELK